ncbi:histidine phosphatase family protein [Paenibacillus fonticola]|uniref:histidine phosphatase family protein n=1 Tax=Paenibacillus fonticola TaxID=379896 RepID=UPI00037ECBF5|nr:histidine phosphatase family protein [Paenibacillus fonticola]
MKIGLMRHYKVHLNLWLLLGRFGWLLEHRSQENKQFTIERARTFLNMIEANKHKRSHNQVLIVTHGAFMKVLRHELLHRGYIGDRFSTPRNGEIYIFEKGY